MKDRRLTELLFRLDKEPQFSTSMFLSSPDDISPTDTRPIKGLGSHRKAMAILGGIDSNSQSRQSPPQPQNRTNSTAVAPWDTQVPSSTKSVAPWDDDPQGQLGGVRPFGQPHFNESENVGQPSTSVRPNTGKLGTTDS